MVGGLWLRRLLDHCADDAIAHAGRLQAQQLIGGEIEGLALAADLGQDDFFADSGVGEVDDVVERHAGFRLVRRGVAGGLGECPTTHSNQGGKRHDPPDRHVRS
jgi:hypothetical protein